MLGDLPLIEGCSCESNAAHLNNITYVLQAMYHFDLWTVKVLWLRVTEVSIENDNFLKDFCAKFLKYWI